MQTPEAGSPLIDAAGDSERSEKSERVVPGAGPFGPGILMAGGPSGPRISLAPMEGVVDAPLRDLYTRHGHYDLLYTEFIRVINQLIPEHVFERECPEMKTGFLTPSGTPVRIQLLGGDAACLADNAAQVASFGSPGVDLNFGCPAPTVNRHDGGASLLQYPDRIFKIVEAVRKAVPAHLPVTAKVRLGFMDTALCLQNAEAVAAGGASELTVHCRTKKQMYQPPVDWTWLPRIREVAKIPLVVNGDIWTVEDYRQARELSGCDNVMIGRGALSNPFLVSEIRGLRAESTFADVQPLLSEFFEINRTTVSPAFAVARGKQWLRYLTRNFAEAREMFQIVKVLRDPVEFFAALGNAHLPAPSMTAVPAPTSAAASASTVASALPSASASTSRGPIVHNPISELR